MCSPNVHFEPFLSSSAQPSTSRRTVDPIGNVAHARLAGVSPTMLDPTSNFSRIASSTTSLNHTINHHSSVLSLAVDERRNLLYSGSQEGYINVWDLDSFQSTARLQGHSASVLALELAPEKNWLFSSSGDNTVRVWDTLTNAPVFVVYPAEDSVGDIFALKWSSVLETLYLGCQSTSIQWICLAGFDNQSRSTPARPQEVGEVDRRFADSVQHGMSRRDAGADSPIISTPDLVPRPHKFFDSVPVALSRSGMTTGGTSTPARRPPTTSALNNTNLTPQKADRSGTETAGYNLNVNGPLSTVGATEKVLHAASQRLDSAAISASLSTPDAASHDPSDAVRTLLVPSTSSVPSAHFGYIYSLALLTLEGDSKNPTVIASGSGDETIKLWHATRSGLSLLATLESPNADGNAVLALASWKTTLFSGLQGGEVEVWDLETCTLVRTIRAHADDVICLETCPESGLLFTAGADGQVRTWDRYFRCINQTQAHKGIVLSLAKVRGLAGSGDRELDGDQARYGELSKVVQLVTGSSDNLIKIWDAWPAASFAGSASMAREASSVEAQRRELELLSLEPTTPSFSSTHTATDVGLTPPTAASTMGIEAASILAASSATEKPEGSPAQWPLLRSLLRRFITFPSISASEEHREDCRQAAHFLKTCFQELGAEARIVPNPVGTNPLVLATFKANAYRSRRGRTAAAHFERSRSTSTSTCTSNASTSASASTDSSESLLDIDRDEEDDDSESEGLSGSILFDHLDETTEASRGEDEEDVKTSGTKGKKRCLFYGHYDCIEAEGSWNSDPFSLDGRDGYLYGRGVSDNKGPILAAACAVHHLLSTRRLYSDVVFLIEGEEENGSIGFIEAVRRYKSSIGKIDVVLLSNSYWLDEETPCLTVGLRGVVRATVSVTSGERDVHSGVEGGAIREPMMDMVKLLARLTGQGQRVALPGFYDLVRPTTQAEIQAYKDIVRIKQSNRSSWPMQTLSKHKHKHIDVDVDENDQVGETKETVESLMAKWRYPSISVHNLRVSGPGNSTLIPSSVSAQVSLRIVPDQDLTSIETSLLNHVSTTFDSLYPSNTMNTMTRNKVNVSVDHKADWWLGSSCSTYFHLLKNAVKIEWNADPISIREGGSIPAIAILEKELGASAVHLPMGQSSDNAHLPNERIRQINLVKGQNVIQRFLQGLTTL